SLSSPASLHHRDLPSFPTRRSSDLYIALGSNLGDRRGYLEKAIQALQEQPGIDVSQVSSYYLTAPIGGPAGQGAFLNAAAELKTDRKSTRLNSSHGSISYAVFCLKK